MYLIWYMYRSPLLSLPLWEMCLPLLENFETNFDHDNVIFSNIYNPIVQIPTQKEEKVPNNFVFWLHWRAWVGNLKQRVPITSKSPKFKGEAQHYVVKLSKSTGARHYCPKIQQVPGTCANSSPTLMRSHDFWPCWPTYLPCPIFYNVQFWGLYWTPLPSLIWDVINGHFLEKYT